MFITKKRHLKIIDANCREHESQRERLENAVAIRDKSLKEKEEAIVELRKEIKQFTFFQDVAKLLGKASGHFINGTDRTAFGALELPDSVATLVDDALGGKSFKHEATTRVVIVAPNGDVTYGVTKQPCDKGRGYRLVQL